MCVLIVCVIVVVVRVFAICDVNDVVETVYDVMTLVVVGGCDCCVDASVILIIIVNVVWLCESWP